MGHVFGAEFRRVENREHLGKPALVVGRDPQLRHDGRGPVGGDHDARAARPLVPARRGRPEARRPVSAQGQRRRHHHPLRASRGARSDVGVHGRHELGDPAPRARRAQGAAHARAHRAQGWDGRRRAPQAVRPGRRRSRVGSRAPRPGASTWPIRRRRSTTRPSRRGRRRSEGKAFMRGSGEAWGAAHAASGEDPDEARAQAERTIAFYTGA